MTLLFFSLINLSNIKIGYHSISGEIIAVSLIIHWNRLRSIVHDVIIPIRKLNPKAGVILAIVKMHYSHFNVGETSSVSCIVRHIYTKSLPHPPSSLLLLLAVFSFSEEHQRRRLWGSSVRGVSQSGIMEWIAISLSRGYSQPRGWTCVSCIGRQIHYHWATREVFFLSNVKRKIG